MSKFADLEQEILEFWQRNDTFQKSLDQESPHGDYVFYDGPPFATGLPHYGHILSSVIKDVVPRYWTMKGYHVRRRWGWDCHGLPIENLVEAKLKLSGKKQIETLGVDVFNDTCRQEVLTYVRQWKAMVERIGRWVEFDNAYLTMDNTYMESVWWALKQLWDKSLIYEGRKVLLYCPRCETPISKFEVAMDNSYQDVTEIAVTVKFKLPAGQKIGAWMTDDKTFALAWTTTPWTLPGNVALAVGKDIKYVIVRAGSHGDEKYIVAKSSLEKVEATLKPNSLEAEITGADLEGLVYEPLYDVPDVKASGKKAYYIATADFVSTEEGTGIVHTAVIYGEDDYNLGVKLDLPMVPLLNSQGKFTDKAPELVREMNFKEADEIVILDLTQRGLLNDQQNHTHSYPYCWRCESPLFYNAVEAWFINIQKIKAKLIERNEQVNWYPSHLKHGRFKHNVESAPDWNISRNRYWATALPFWRCQTDRGHKVVCFGSVAELKEAAVNFNEVYPSDSIEDVDLHKHLIDKVIVRCPDCGGEMRRIPEVIDCWVESGSMPFAEYHYPFENKKVFESRLPGQYIAEYIAQTRAWFYYMHVMAVALFDSISFENVVSTGTILNEQGKKMSKSKRNYPDPWEVINAYGADALRFYLLNSVVMQAENLNFSDQGVKEVYNKVMNALYNSVSFYLLYGVASEPAPRATSGHLLDRWIVSLTNRLIQRVTSAMDAYNTVSATRAIQEFVSDLSSWYIRRSRDRFKDDNDRPDAVATLRQVLQDTAKVIAPFLPFAAEHIWQRLPSAEAASVHLSRWPQADELVIENDVISDMESARQIVEKAHALRASKNIKVRQPLEKLEVTADLGEDYLSIVALEVNVKKVVRVKKLSSGAEVVTDEGRTLALHTGISEELQAEGALRELVRLTNSQRKEAGLSPHDLITIYYNTDSDFLRHQVIEVYKTQLEKQTAATAWQFQESMPTEHRTVAVAGDAIKLKFGHDV